MMTKQRLGMLVLCLALGCGPAASESSDGGNSGEGGLSEDELREAWVGNYTQNFHPQNRFGGEHTEYSLLPDGAAERRGIDCGGRPEQADIVFQWRLAEEGGVEVFTDTGVVVSIEGDIGSCDGYRGYLTGDRSRTPDPHYKGSYCPRRPRDDADLDSSSTCLMDPCDERARECQEEYGS